MRSESPAETDGMQRLERLTTNKGHADDDGEDHEDDDPDGAVQVSPELE